MCDISHGSECVLSGSFTPLGGADSSFILLQLRNCPVDIFTEYYKVSLAGRSGKNAAEDTGHLRFVIISNVHEFILLTFWTHTASPTSKNDRLA